MAGIVNDVLYALNSDFTGGNSLLAAESNGLVANGKMWIGSTAVNAGGTHINVGSLVSPNSTVSIGYSSPNITIDIPNPVLTASGILTSLQIKALNATPITLIAAPGAGRLIKILTVSGKLNYGGTNVFVAGSSQNISLYYAATTLWADFMIMSNTGIVENVNYIATLASQPQNCQDIATNFENKAITAFNPIAVEISGNAANNNTISYIINYQIISL